MGVGIPLCYMLCSSDCGSNHEQIALEITLKIIFKRMESERPNATVIDKSWTKYNAIRNVITEDPCCWQITNGEMKQISCKILLCWFHVKNAWVDDLLPKVNASERNQLY